MTGAPGATCRVRIVMLESPLDEAVRPGTSSVHHRPAACPLRSASTVLPNVQTGQIADGHTASLLALWEEPFASAQWHNPAYVYLNGRELATTLPADEQVQAIESRTDCSQAVTLIVPKMRFSPPFKKPHSDSGDVPQELTEGRLRGACRVFLVHGPLNTPLSAPNHRTVPLHCAAFAIAQAPPPRPEPGNVSAHCARTTRSASGVSTSRTAPGGSTSTYVTARR